MTVQPAMDAKAICTLLYERLHDAALGGTVLSAFEHAVNIETPAGLVSILTETRCLQPFAVRAACGTLQAHFAPGEQVLINADTLRTGRTAISLETAATVDLSVAHGMQSAIAGHSREHHSALDPAPLLSVLASGGEPDGLSALVTRLKSNVYADFLRPRLPRLFAAVAAGEAAEAGEAAAAIAGCGIGLTPSSDDWLYGHAACNVRRWRFGKHCPRSAGDRGPRSTKDQPHQRRISITERRGICFRGCASSPPALVFGFGCITNQTGSHARCGIRIHFRKRYADRHRFGNHSS